MKEASNYPRLVVFSSVLTFQCASSVLPPGVAFE